MDNSYSLGWYEAFTSDVTSNGWQVTVVVGLIVGALLMLSLGKAYLIAVLGETNGKPAFERVV